VQFSDEPRCLRRWLAGTYNRSDRRDPMAKSKQDKSSIAGCEGVECARRWRADSPRSPHTRSAANRRRSHCATPSLDSRPPCRNCAATSGAPTERPPVARRPKHGARTRSGAAPRRAGPAEVDPRRNSRETSRRSSRSSRYEPIRWSASSCPGVWVSRRQGCHGRCALPNSVPTDPRRLRWHGHVAFRRTRVKSSSPIREPESLTEGAEWPSEHRSPDL
jgi:hypothetical protein